MSFGWMSRDTNSPYNDAHPKHIKPTWPVEIGNYQTPTDSLSNCSKSEHQSTLNNFSTCESSTPKNSRDNSMLFYSPEEVASCGNNSSGDHWASCLSSSSTHSLSLFFSPPSEEPGEFAPFETEKQVHSTPLNSVAAQLYLDDSEISTSENGVSEDESLVDESHLLTVPELRKKFEALGIFPQGSLRGYYKYKQRQRSQLPQNLFSSLCHSEDSDITLTSSKDHSDIFNSTLDQYSERDFLKSNTTSVSLQSPLSEQQTDLRSAVLFNRNSFDLSGSPQTDLEGSSGMDNNQDEIVQGAGDGDLNPEGVTEVNEFKMPETVQLLRGENGVPVYIVGTAHFSKESHDDVRKVIREFRPSHVVVELCNARQAIMLRRETPAEEAANATNVLSLPSVRESIRRNGGNTMLGVLHSLLLFMSLKVQQKTGLSPGGEFRAAFEEARKLTPMPQIHLGDRNVLVTLQRAWHSLSTLKKIHLLVTLLVTDVGDLTLEEIEKFKGKDVLEQLMAELEKDFPEMSRVIVSERDLFLASSIHTAALECSPDSSVVAVVGIGHQRGIVQHWDNARDIDIKQLCIVPKSKSFVPWKRLVQLSLLSGTAYVLYRWLK